MTVTVCSDHTTTTYTPENTQAMRYKIGFANLTEEIPFGRDVRRGLEGAAKPHGQIELVIADNQLSGAQALTLADALFEQERWGIVTQALRDRAIAGLQKSLDGTDAL